MAIDQLVGLPNRSMPQADFDEAVAMLMSQWPTFIDQANAMAALLTSLVAGTAVAMSYTFDTSLVDDDPTAGKFRLSAATQNLATAIRLDLVGVDGVTYTSIIDGFAASTSVIKGQLRLVKTGDPTKWLLFDVTAVASPSGYKNVTVVNTGSSAASPFANGESVQLLFTRTGDVGTAGTVAPRVTSITTSATPTPNATNTDQYVVTALASGTTFGAPTGTPIEGQRLLIRIKDNGTARTLVFNGVYRAGPNLALPGITIVNKLTYLGFVYNSLDTKWDLIAVLENI